MPNPDELLSRQPLTAEQRVVIDAFTYQPPKCARCGATVTVFVLSAQCPNCGVVFRG